MLLMLLQEQTERSPNAPYRQKVGQPMPAADLLTATRRSQPQPQPPKESKDPAQSPQQRQRLGPSL